MVRAALFMNKNLISAINSLFTDFKPNNIKDLLWIKGLRAEITSEIEGYEENRKELIKNFGQDDMAVNKSIEAYLNEEIEFKAGKRKFVISEDCKLGNIAVTEDFIEQMENFMEIDYGQETA